MDRSCRVWGRVLGAGVVVAGCAAPVDEAEVDGEDTAPVATCSTALVDTWPADGATDAYYRGAVELTLSEPDATATVSASFAGELTRSADGLTLVYAPSAPLAPDTTYTLTLDACFGAETVTFTTSAYGEPVEDPAALVGRTYAVDLDDGRWVQGGEARGIITTYLEQRVLLGVTAANGGSVDLLAGMPGVGSERDRQDETVSTVAMPAGDLTGNPWLAFDADPLVVGLGGVEGALRRFHLEGSFAADGSSLGGVAVSGWLDARSVEGGAVTEDLCELLGNLGAPCTACPDDGAVACVPFAVDRMEGREVPDLTLVEVADGTACSAAGFGVPAGLVLLAGRRRRASGARREADAERA